MLLTALLIACAGAEWVEISQQHYRKPLRTYHFTTKAIDFEDTTKPWYNHSITEYSWNKDLEHGDEATGGNEHYEPERFNYKPTKATVEKGTLKGTVQRVPNVGNVRRVQLNNSPVKSPNINWQSDRDKNTFNIHGNTAVQDTTDKQPYDSKIPNKDVKYAHTIPRTPFLTEDKDGMLFTEAPVDKNKIKHEHHNHTAINPPKHVNKKIKGNTNSDVAEDVYSNEDIRTENNKPNGFESNEQEDSHPYSDNTKTKDDHNNDIKTKDEVTGPRHKQDKDLTQSLKIKANKTITKADTIESLMKFMVVVADTMSKNSRRSFNGKLQYLQELKNNILANIEDHLDVTWPDDSAPSGSARRRSRSARAHTEPRGHVEFPSSESALMSISFLTFAVFLIKLVLQVIQTYKNKTMMVAPLVVAAAGRAALAQRKHN